MRFLGLILISVILTGCINSKEPEEIVKESSTLNVEDSSLENEKEDFSEESLNYEETININGGILLTTQLLYHILEGKEVIDSNGYIVKSKTYPLMIEEIRLNIDELNLPEDVLTKPVEVVIPSSMLPANAGENLPYYLFGVLGIPNIKDVTLSDDNSAIMKMNFLDQQTFLATFKYLANFTVDTKNLTENVLLSEDLKDVHFHVEDKNYNTEEIISKLQESLFFSYLYQIYSNDKKAINIFIKNEETNEIYETVNYYF